MECLGVCGSESNVVLGAGGVETDNDVDYFGGEADRDKLFRCPFPNFIRQSALATLRRKN